MDDATVKEDTMMEDTTTLDETTLDGLSQIGARSSFLMYLRYVRKRHVEEGKKLDEIIMMLLEREKSAPIPQRREVHIGSSVLSIEELKAGVRAILMELEREHDISDYSSVYIYYLISSKMNIGRSAIIRLLQSLGYTRKQIYNVREKKTHRGFYKLKEDHHNGA